MQLENSVPTAAGLDARQFKRYDAIFDVTLSSGSNFWTGFTRNISSGGLFVACEDPMPPGSIVRFQFRLLPDTQLHEVMGEVRWVRTALAATEEAPEGMGVRFLRIPDALRDAIDRFITQQRDSLFYDDEDDAA